MGAASSSSNVSVGLNRIGPLVSVIVLHGGREDLLEPCLNALISTQYDSIEVLLILNPGSPGSTDRIRSRFNGRLRVICAERRLGYSAGNNLGARAASGEYLVFLNDDVVVEPSWLFHLVAAASRDVNLAILQPKVLALARPDTFEHTGAAGGFMDCYGYSFARGRIFDHLEQDRGQYDDDIEIFYATGAAFFIHRNVFEELGGFEEIFEHQYEEIDLCWRALLRGYSVKIIPSAIVYHLGGATIPYGSPQKIYWNHRNSVLTLLRCYGLRSLVSALPVRLLLDILAMPYYLWKNPRSLLGVPRAWFWIVRHLPAIRRQRARVQQTRKVSDQRIKSLMACSSIVWEHFILRRKTFAQIQASAKVSRF